MCSYYDNDHSFNTKSRCVDMALIKSNQDKNSSILNGFPEYFYMHFKYVCDIQAQQIHFQWSNPKKTMKKSAV